MNIYILGFGGSQSLEKQKSNWWPNVCRETEKEGGNLRSYVMLLEAEVGI